MTSPDQQVEIDRTPERPPNWLELGVAAAQAIRDNLPVDGFGDMRRLKDYADVWGSAARSAILREQAKFHLTAKARPPLDPQVERGAECYHGTPRACESYRCGSNCSQRFDRMHPCPACLIAEIQDLRLALEVAGVDPYSVPRYRPASSTHEFDEDVNDGSMCACGIPALTHDQVYRPD